MADDGILARLDALFNPVPRDLSLRPKTSFEKVASVNPRQGGLGAALAPLGDALMGRSANLGILPLSPMTGDRSTVGGELLQGLGNLGLAGLEGVRRTGETVSEVPFAFGRALGTESESAYNQRMSRLADVLDDQTRMQQGQSGTGFSVAEPRTVVGGPSYQQTPTDVDQDAAIRSQIRDAQDITEETGVFGDITQPSMGVPDFVGGAPSARKEIEQAIAAASAEDDGDVTIEMQPTLDDGGEEDVALGTATKPGTSSVKGADTEIKQSTVQALDDVLKQVKPDAKPKDYDDYMKEFADLTGLDISGQPDNSQALMAFGLALMQNKAGKGFNVGQMLSEVGSAGEKAMPALAAARKEAKTTRIKAAEFAISRKDKDEAAALNKQFYYVVPKGGKGFVSNFDKGELKRFNSRELFNLDSDADFQAGFEIIPMSTYEKVSAAIMKEPEYGKKYANSYAPVSLFTDAPEDLQISVQRTDGNYKGPDAPQLGRFNKAEYETYANRLAAMDKDLNKFADKLGEAYSIVDSGEVTTGDQIADAATGFARALGFEFGADEATPTAKVKRILNVIAAEKAPAILQEAGKTISDADRARVQEIVGKLGPMSDPEDLKQALRDMYARIVDGGKADIRAGMTTLNQYSGVKSPTARAKMVNGVLVLE